MSKRFLLNSQLMYHKMLEIVEFMAVAHRPQWLCRKAITRIALFLDRMAQIFRRAMPDD
jgi:hypothetical protein